ncbi:aldehyde dehydrogenase family protein [uncultured Amnibacterium sp.]|uniref:aldehyde dehydrogenase family protein n=1 Tax=uncultured Amnibacterium sp. TaxID=1631851 RepID=UPI0035C976D9
MSTTSEVVTAPSVIQAAREQLQQLHIGHVIDGKPERSTAAATLDVVDPSTGEVLVQLPAGSAQDVDRAVSAAQRAFPAWSALTLGARAKVLADVAAIVDDHLDELVALESLNTGKPLLVSRDEIPLVAEVFRFMGGAARALQAPATGEYTAGHVSMIRREPLGVVGAVTPWNYPLLTASWKIAAALAMGNTMVLKPSELTPLTTLRFMELVSDVLPAGVLNVVLGTGEVVGSALSKHPDIAAVSLTGSIASGQYVVRDSIDTLKVTHLELGGKAPVVVFPDADVDKLAVTLRAAGYWNSGQECGAATRVLCHSSIKDQLVAKLATQATSLRVGVPTDGDEIELGPLISRSQLDRVAGMVDRARSAGATIAVGGTAPDSDGFFYEPTVITDIPAGSEITRDEVFGPVVTVETFDTEFEAIGSSNATTYGLAASVWTQDVGRALRVSSALNFGTVWVNSHLVLATEMPWGGFGKSGSGRELSTFGLEDFSRTKHVMISTGAELSGTGLSGK